MLAQSRSNVCSVSDPAHDGNTLLRQTGPNGNGTKSGHTTQAPAIGEPFNPYQRFKGAFIPEAVCKHKGLSSNSKLVYGRLCRFAGQHGKAYPAMKTLATECGLGTTQARRALRELQAAGFLKNDGKHFRSDGRGGTTVYVFLWHTVFEGEIGEPRNAARKKPPQRSFTARQPQRKTEEVPQAKSSTRTPTENRNQKESGSHHQESGEENHPEDGVNLGRVVEIHGAPKIKNNNLKSQNADDEQPKPAPEKTERVVTAKAVMEFSARLAVRHGPGWDSKETIRVCREELDRYNVLLSAFVEWEPSKTTSPEKVRHNGYYRSIARQFAREHGGLGSIDATLEQLEQVRAGLAELERKPATEKCAYCKCDKGNGTVINVGELVPCPVCATNEWREKVMAANYRDKASQKRAVAKTQGANSGSISQAGPPHQETAIVGGIS